MEQEGHVYEFLLLPPKTTYPKILSMHLLHLLDGHGKAKWPESERASNTTAP